MRERKLLRYKLLREACFMIPLASTVLFSCSPKSDRSDVVAKVAKIVEENYILLPTEYQKDKLVAASFKAIDKDANQPKTNINELIETIKKLPDKKRDHAVNTAIKAYMSALPLGYNTYTKPESTKWINDPARKAGVGLIIRMTDAGEFLAVDSLEGSASHREGMPIGNMITKIDGVDVKGMDLDEVAGRIRGPIDTQVKIDYGDRTYTLVRSEVTFQNILNATWKTKNGDVEYILLRSTVSGTAQQLKNLLFKLGERKAIVLDLRKLHPGDPTESFKVASLFLKTGRMGGIRIRTEGNTYYEAGDGGVFFGPLYVIIGKHTSPYAEIIAMALSQSPELVLVGADTSGKAFLSKRFAIPEQEGEISLTVGEVLNNKDVPLYKTGIKVKYSVEDIIPSHPPLEKPDPKDPAQNKINELMMKR